MKYYYKDLKREDFSSDEAYLTERVKRGFAVGFTFSECYSHWLEDFAEALDQTLEKHNPPKEK